MQLEKLKAFSSEQMIISFLLLCLRIKIPNQSRRKNFHLPYKWRNNLNIILDQHRMHKKGQNKGKFQ
jgi:hypothetical protein